MFLERKYFDELFQIIDTYRSLPPAFGGTEGGRVKDRCPGTEIPSLLLGLVNPSTVNSFPFSFQLSPLN